MPAINNVSEYCQRVDQIQALKHRLWILASQRGNLDPEVLQISQEMDEHIVLVQKYWKYYSKGEALPVTG